LPWTSGNPCSLCNSQKSQSMSVFTEQWCGVCARGHAPHSHPHTKSIQTQEGKADSFSDHFTQPHTHLMRSIDLIILSWVSQPTDTETKCPLLVVGWLTTGSQKAGKKSSLKINRKSGVLLFYQSHVKYFRKILKILKGILIQVR